jgi:hypothetical protein
MVRPIARWGRKQNGYTPVLDVQSRDGAGTKWPWKSLKNVDGKMFHFRLEKWWAADTSSTILVPGYKFNHFRGTGSVKKMATVYPGISINMKVYGTFLMLNIILYGVGSRKNLGDKMSLSGLDTTSTVEAINTSLARKWRLLKAYGITMEVYCTFKFLNIIFVGGRKFKVGGKMCHFAETGNEGGTSCLLGYPNSHIPIHRFRCCCSIQEYHG